jgi:arginyl-tRNA synthetase
MTSSSTSISIQAQLDAAFRSAIQLAFAQDIDPVVGPAARPDLADFQANAAMSLAKKVGKSPRDVAQQIVDKLDLSQIASEVSIAGAGFINIKLSDAFLSKQLEAVRADARLGVPPTSSPQTVVIDYAGPNIAKQMHIGHLRSTILGDAAVRVLSFVGHNVIKQNHVGDWGTQFGRVMLALWYEAAAKHNIQLPTLDGWVETLKQIARKELPPTARLELLSQIAQQHIAWIDQDPTGELFFAPYLKNDFPTLERLDELYSFASAATDNDDAARFDIKGKTLKELPSFLATFVQQQHRPENAQEKLAWEQARKVTLDNCQQLFARMNILLKLEDVRGESDYRADLPGVVADLKQLGLAVETDGAVGVFIDGEERPPLLIQKGNDGYLYGTTDLAAARYRVQKLGASRCVYFVDSRQRDHLRQVFEVAAKAGWTTNASGTASFEHAMFGTIQGEDKKPFKSRTGGIVKLAALLDEATERSLELVKQKSPDADKAFYDQVSKAVGIGAIKYFDMARDRTKDYVFSFDAMLSMDGNTAPYLQYAYARTRSIVRKSDTPPGAIVINHVAERNLALHLFKLGSVIELVVRELKPHHLCTYLFELSQLFSSFYEACPVLKSDEPVRSSRLALCDVTAGVLALGLDLLGIEHPEQM